MVSAASVEEYYHAMDSIFRHGKGDRTYWNRQYDSILAQVGTGLDSCMSVPLFDIEHIKADFLIAHIDSAFCRVGPGTGTGNTVSTCSYVMSCLYRIGHEGVELVEGQPIYGSLGTRKLINKTYSIQHTYTK